MAGEAFHADVGKVLTHSVSPGNVVMLNNPALHKAGRLREAIAPMGTSILVQSNSGPVTAHLASSQNCRSR